MDQIVREGIETGLHPNSRKAENGLMLVGHEKLSFLPKESIQGIFEIVKLVEAFVRANLHAINFYSHFYCCATQKGFTDFPTVFSCPRNSGDRRVT